MVDWQSESDLDSIRNSCDVFFTKLIDFSLWNSIWNIKPICEESSDIFTYKLPPRRLQLCLCFFSSQVALVKSSELKFSFLLSIINVPFPYLPSPRSIWCSTFQRTEIYLQILQMSMTESTQWTCMKNWIIANIARNFVLETVTLTNTNDRNGNTNHFNVLMSTINLASQRAVQPNSPPSLSLSFKAFCWRVQVKSFFVSKCNHVCHCSPVAQGENGEGDDAPRCQIASKGDETESRSEYDVKESPLWKKQSILWTRTWFRIFECTTCPGCLRRGCSRCSPRPGRLGREGDRAFPVLAPFVGIEVMTNRPRFGKIQILSW